MNDSENFCSVQFRNLTFEKVNNRQSILKSRSLCPSVCLSVCLSVCPQVVKIMTYLHPTLPPFMVASGVVRGLLGWGGGCQGAGQNRAKLVVEVIGGVLRGSFSHIEMHCKYLL